MATAAKKALKVILVSSNCPSNDYYTVLKLDYSSKNSTRLVDCLSPKKVVSEVLLRSNSKMSASPDQV